MWYFCISLKVIKGRHLVPRNINVDYHCKWYALASTTRTAVTYARKWETFTPNWNFVTLQTRYRLYDENVIITGKTLILISFLWSLFLIKFNFVRVFTFIQWYFKTTIILFLAFYSEYFFYIYKIPNVFFFCEFHRPSG